MKTTEELLLAAPISIEEQRKLDELQTAASVSERCNRVRIAAEREGLDWWAACRVAKEAR